MHLDQATQSTLTYKDSVICLSLGERLKIIFFVRLVTLLYKKKKRWNSQRGQRRGVGKATIPKIRDDLKMVLRILRSFYVTTNHVMKFVICMKVAVRFRNGKYSRHQCTYTKVTGGPFLYSNAVDKSTILNYYNTVPEIDRRWSTNGHAIFVGYAKSSKHRLRRSNEQEPITCCQSCDKFEK